MKEEGTYYPARDGEGLTVFMMGSIMLEYNRKPLQIPGGPRERYCSWYLYCFIRVRRAYTGRSFWICSTEMVNAPILRGVYGLRYSGSANFWREVSCRHGNISAQTEESTDGMAGNCRCTLMPGILRIRQRRPCAPMTRHSKTGLQSVSGRIFSPACR